VPCFAGKVAWRAGGGKCGAYERCDWSCNKKRKDGRKYGDVDVVGIRGRVISRGMDNVGELRKLRF
jgi:hypothetical protein